MTKGLFPILDLISDDFDFSIFSVIDPNICPSNEKV